MSKEKFKEFARNNPKLINYVKNNDISWQKLYETYEIYGEDKNIWNKYLSDNNTIKNIGEAKLNDIFNMIKKMDVDSVKKGVESIQKAIGMIQELGLGKNNSHYEPKPLYKHLDD